MGNYTLTNSMVAGNVVLALPIKTNFDELDDQTHASGAAAGLHAGMTGFGNLLDNSSLDVWNLGDNVAPSAWAVIGTGATVEKEEVIVKRGLYSAKLTRTSNDCYIHQLVHNASPYLRSRKVILRGWVWAEIPNRARLRIDDGTTVTYSPYHTGNSAWQFLKVTVTLGASLNTLGVGLQIDSGNTSAYLGAAILVEGEVVYRHEQKQPSFNQFPRRARMWHEDATVVAGNSLVQSVNNTQAYNCIFQQFPPALNDAFTHSFWLMAGTYTLSVLGRTSTDIGKIDWYIDGVLSVSAQDWYAATPAANVVKTASITVVGDGYHVLKGVVSAKNASSSAYNMRLNKYWITPSSD